MIFWLIYVCLYIIAATAAARGQGSAPHSSATATHCTACNCARKHRRLWAENGGEAAKGAGHDATTANAVESSADGTVAANCFCGQLSAYSVRICQCNATSKSTITTKVYSITSLTTVYHLVILSISVY